MFDAMFFVSGILGAIVPIALIGLIVYGIIVWRRRASEHPPDDDEDAGIGSVRRMYFYVVAFASLMMATSGIVLVVQFILDSIAGDELLSRSNTGLAAGVSLLIVGAPLWYFHWRYIQRSVREMPGETRSIIRKLYIYITLAAAGSILIYTALNTLNWVFRTDHFSGYDLAALIIWSGIWALHWLIEQREGQATHETRAVRRLYIYIASLVGLAMLSVGVGRVMYFILLEGYNAFTSTPLLAGDAGLGRPALREMLAVAIVGGGIWGLHWFYAARHDFDSALRQVYLYIFAILAGVMATLVALGIIFHEFLTWLFGTYSADTVVQHFEFLPGSVATLAVGVALWAYHWHRVRYETGEFGGAALSARRVYTYILVAIGTGALAVAIFMLVGAAVKLMLASFGDVVVGGDQWKRPLINIITLAALGAPVWGYYWRDTQRRALDIAEDERQSTSRRIFLFAALGIGVLALLGSVSALLFIFLRDLLDFSLSLDTLNDMAEPIAIVAAAAAFLPHYWAVYRQDHNAALPEGTPVSDAPAEPPRKQVTLLAADGAALSRQLSGALGYEIRLLRWADTDAVTPALTDEDCALLAQSIADAPGGFALLIPDAGTLRVLSHD